jgi:hypothetical protein
MRRVMSIVLASILVIVLAPTSAKAVAYPGDRRIYTVALGAIPNPGVTTGPVWMRSALYFFFFFFGDATVREGFWFWSRSQAIGAVSTGITSSGCDNCTVRTATGFESATKSLSGTYTNNTSSIAITWSTSQSETWSVSQPAGDPS